MKPLEKTIYPAVIFASGLTVMLWSFFHPTAQPGSQALFIVCIALAIAMELVSPSLPHYGTVSAAGAVYIFLLNALDLRQAVLAAFTATLFRAAIRDKEDRLPRVLAPFEKTVSVGLAGLLPSIFTLKLVHGVAAQGENFHFWSVIHTSLLFFILDNLTEGIGIGFSIPFEKQRVWFKAKYRTLFLSLLSCLLGGLGAYVFGPDPYVAILIFLAVILLQFGMSSIVGKDLLFGGPAALLAEMEKGQIELRNAQKSYQEMKRRFARKTFEQGVLLDFGRSVGTNLTLDYAFEALLDILRKLYRYQSCIIFFADAAAGESFLRPKRYSTPYADFCKNLHIRFGETLVGLAAQQAKEQLVDARKFHNPGSLIEKERSQMAVPLIVEERVKGVLYVGSVEEGAFTEADAQLLNTIAYQAAIVLVYAESYEFTVHLATTDGLTGLYTHRYFQERLLEEVRRSERYHQPLSLIMIDLDHFKEYNDTYGHPQGDALLKQVSQILKECTRETDIVCRYGGDEFAILLVETTKETTLTIAGRIREIIELRANVGGTVVITSSIGVASFPEDAATKMDLLGEADKALYQSKYGGRNRVVAARPKT